MKRPRYSKAEEIEILPDAWDRFKRGVQIVAKTKPKHRASKAPKRPAKKQNA